MFYKIINMIMALGSLTLCAQDNFNNISVNTGSGGVGSSQLRLSHQSCFYMPNDDSVMIDLNHSLHRRHIQNDMGLAYRTILGEFGMGANFYYSHTTKPKAWLHQVSPGVELLYKQFQLSYNLYLPCAGTKNLRHATLYHSTLSEVGLKWMATKDVSIGLLPFYDHLNKNWGVNSSINYTLQDRYTFGVYPFYKPQNSGVHISFGISFGTGKDSKSTHRSNAFSYIVKDNPAKEVEIYVEKAKPVLPILDPVVSYPVFTPSDIQEGEIEEPGEKDEKQEEAIPEPKEPEKVIWNWFDYVPNLYETHEYGVDNEIARALSFEASRPSLATAREIEDGFVDIQPDMLRVVHFNEEMNEFHRIRTESSETTPDDLLATPSVSPHPPVGSPPRIYDDYVPQRQSFSNRHQSTPAPRSAPMVVREDYQGT